MIPCDWINKQDKKGHKFGIRGFIKGFIRHFNYNRLDLQFNAPDDHIDTVFVRTLTKFHFEKNKTRIYLSVIPYVTNSLAAILYLAIYTCGLKSEQEIREMSLNEYIIMALIL